MKVSLYSESPDPGPGGAEQFIALLAEVISTEHEVTIVHHKKSLSTSSLGQFSGCDLSRVFLRYSPLDTDISISCRTPWMRYIAARNWRRQLSDGSDVFISLLHNKPPFCSAKSGILIVLFPTYDPLLLVRETEAKIEKFLSKLADEKKKRRRGRAPKTIKQPSLHGVAGMFVWRWLHRSYTQWEWRRRLNSYNIKLSISDFTRVWTRNRWQMESQLLYPPVRLPRQIKEEKRHQILSVGRFATTGHTKKQIEMLRCFGEIKTALPGWIYACVGGLNDSLQDRAYFDSACALGEEGIVEVKANIEHAYLQKLYANSAIFWHAAGFGEDHELHPELAEHFGLTTVEAMAAGCVPVVINKGGQPEIVEHGVSGFVWDTLDELKTFTLRLALNDELRDQMSSAAKFRAERFSKEACIANLFNVLGWPNVKISNPA